MFISYECQKYLGYDNKTKLYNYQYKIIDDDFETIDITGLDSIISHVLGSAVIDTYEKRNLPVATNLIKAILWDHKNHGYNMKDTQYWNKTYNPKFAKYEKELEKYLLLL
jgi:hypothetical protein